MIVYICCDVFRRRGFFFVRVSVYFVKLIFYVKNVIDL